MLCVLNKASVGKPPPRIASPQKVKTWKFAAKYIWKERFTEDKAELGRWTKDSYWNLDQRL